MAQIEDRGVSALFLRQFTAEIFTEIRAGRARQLDKINGKLTRCKLKGGEDGGPATNVRITPHNILTKEVVECFVKPRTRDHPQIVGDSTSANGVRYVELVRRQLTSENQSARFRKLVGKADIFVSHAWGGPGRAGGSWLKLVEVLVRHSAAAEAKGLKPPFYWVDIFAINQFWGTPECNADMPDWEHMSPEVGFQRVIRCTGTTLLFMDPWDKPECCERAWCLFEILHTIQSRGGQSLCAAMCRSDQRKLVRSTQNTGVSHRAPKWLEALGSIDLKKAKAWSTSDQDRIFALVRAWTNDGARGSFATAAASAGAATTSASNGVGGFEHVNLTIANALRTSVANFAAAMVEVSERERDAAISGMLPLPALPSSRASRGSARGFENLDMESGPEIEVKDNESRIDYTDKSFLERLADHCDLLVWRNCPSLPTLILIPPMVLILVVAVTIFFASYSPAVDDDPIRLTVDETQGAYIVGAILVWLALTAYLSHRQDTYSVSQMALQKSLLTRLAHFFISDFTQLFFLFLLGNSLLLLVVNLIIWGSISVSNLLTLVLVFEIFYIMSVLEARVKNQLYTVYFQSFASTCLAGEGEIAAALSILEKLVISCEEVFGKSTSSGVTAMIQLSLSQLLAFNYMYGEDGKNASDEHRGRRTGNQNINPMTVEMSSRVSSSSGRSSSSSSNNDVNSSYATSGREAIQKAWRPLSALLEEGWRLRFEQFSFWRSFAKVFSEDIRNVGGSHLKLKDTDFDDSNECKCEFMESMSGCLSDDENTDDDKEQNGDNFPAFSKCFWLLFGGYVLIGLASVVLDVPRSDRLDPAIALIIWQCSTLICIYLWNKLYNILTLHYLLAMASHSVLALARHALPLGDGALLSAMAVPMHRVAFGMCGALHGWAKSDGSFVDDVEVDRAGSLALAAVAGLEGALTEMSSSSSSSSSSSNPEACLRKACPEIFRAFDGRGSDSSSTVGMVADELLSSSDAFHYTFILGEIALLLLQRGNISRLSEGPPDISDRYTRAGTSLAAKVTSTRRKLLGERHPLTQYTMRQLHVYTPGGTQQTGKNPGP